MWQRIDQRIWEASNSRIVEHERYAKAVHDENTRRRRRSTRVPELLPVRRPKTWDLDPGFNPYIVRARSQRIASAITNRIRGRNYTPRPPAGFAVPKRSGGTRIVSTFQIADEVVSNCVFQSLMRKNLPLLSARAYAYRSDRGVHDAISYIASEFARENRLYIAEYDFSAFFDSVKHEHILRMLDVLKIARTSTEQYIVERFLESPEPRNGGTTSSQTARVRGIPQGTSLSLFLSNIAASNLDRSLERLGVGFVRYADDTLIWSRDYGQITEAVSILYESSQEMGSPINSEKSPGIRLLVDRGTRRAEIPSTTAVEYLGHTISLDSIRMRDSSLSRIRSRIEHLIFTNLLLEPLNGTQDPCRLSDVDRDYVALIWQLRRYLYGSLSEAEVRRFLKGDIRPMSFEGVMSFYPLVNDDDSLKQLDEWISTRIWLAMRKRARILSTVGFELPSPHGLTKADLIKYMTVSSRSGAIVDLRIPSVRKIVSVIRKAVRVQELRAVHDRTQTYLYY